MTEQKTLLPVWAESLYTRPAASEDVTRLLHALETALGKVERAKETISLLITFIDSNTPKDDGEVRSHCLSAKHYCQKTLKELEE